ncbi:MAG: KpsF/GutQ family sugar-phosphate isomerase [Bacteroidia bacterium]|nr:KpsF/GutQ family sugar-phosphate isomerase [Bacteroidia bacterium]
MIKTSELVAIALQTLKTEASSIARLKKSIGREFTDCVKLILFSKGRVIVTGVGKSSLIAQKIVATLNSTGTPSVFMHAADAVHGDLGMIRKDDIVICLSKSGSTAEIKVLVPLVKAADNTLIAICGNMKSYLAIHADYVIDASVKIEACPMNLAPTSSTIAQMAIGDALAVCLLRARGFTEKDFARFHPGGLLGKQLYLRVSDLFSLNPKPVVKPGDPLRKVIVVISSNRLGATAVLEKNMLKGIITDGDLRRMLESHKEIEGVIAADIMTKNPRSIDKNALAIEALQLMKKHSITQLIVTSGKKFEGFIHLHDLLREGLV